MNTAIIAPSTSSTRLMNALTWVSIDFHEHSMQSGDSSAVSSDQEHADAVDADGVV